MSNYICLKKRGAKAQLFLFVNHFARTDALRALLEKRLHLREASRECGLFFRGEPIERGIDHLKVIFSDEPPLPPTDGARAPASISFVPTAAGLVLAGAIVRDLIGAQLR